MKVLISGGHLTPAVAYIDFLQEKHPDIDISFVGRLYSQEKNKQKAQEKQAMDERNIKFIPISSGKINTKNPIKLLFQLLQVLSAVGKSLQIVYSEKPDVFLSFGSYLAVPVAVACWLLRVPVITHEQTRTVGVANKFIMYIARHVALSFSDTRKYAPKSKTVLTGNPIRKSLLQPHPQTPEWMNKSFRKPILYITGGSQGSEILNATISQVIRTLLKDWMVIHQCGPSSKTRNYKEDLERIRGKIAGNIRYRYIVREWITEQEQAWIYKHAHLAISRAGANTVLELSHFCIPTIYIPLPFSHHNEQQLNAEMLQRKKQALVLLQSQLSPEMLLKKIQEALRKHSEMTTKLEKTNTSKDPAASLHKLVSNYAKAKKGS